jgi:hypothetical protein
MDVHSIPRRRLLKGLGAVFTIVASVIGASSQAQADSDVGELMSSFHTEINQIRDGLAAPLQRPEGHISPFAGVEEVCDQQVVGTWLTAFDSDPDGVLGISWEVSLDGVPLDETQTPTLKRDSGDGGILYAFTRGVPVIGVLDAGAHTLVYEIFLDGEFALALAAEIESSSAHC